MFELIPMTINIWLELMRPQEDYKRNKFFHFETITRHFTLTIHYWMVKSSEFAKSLKVFIVIVNHKLWSWSQTRLLDAKVKDCCLSVCFSIAFTTHWNNLNLPYCTPFSAPIGLFECELPVSFGNIIVKQLASLSWSRWSYQNCV